MQTFKFRRHRAVYSRHHGKVLQHELYTNSWIWPETSWWLMMPCPVTTLSSCFTYLSRSISLCFCRSHPPAGVNDFTFLREHKWDEKQTNYPRYFYYIQMEYSCCTYPYFDLPVHLASILLSLLPFPFTGVNNVDTLAGKETNQLSFIISLQFDYGIVMYSILLYQFVYQPAFGNRTVSVFSYSSWCIR